MLINFFMKHFSNSHIRFATPCINPQYFRFGNVRENLIFADIHEFVSNSKFSLILKTPFHRQLFYLLNQMLACEFKNLQIIQKLKKIVT